MGIRSVVAHDTGERTLLLEFHLRRTTRFIFPRHHPPYALSSKATSNKLIYIRKCISFDDARCPRLPRVWTPFPCRNSKSLPTYPGFVNSRRRTPPRGLKHVLTQLSLFINTSFITSSNFNGRTRSQSSMMNSYNLYSLSLRIHKGVRVKYDERDWIKSWKISIQSVFIFKRIFGLYLIRYGTAISLSSWRGSETLFRCSGFYAIDWLYNLIVWSVVPTSRTSRQ